VARWVERNSDHVEWVRPDAGALCCIRLKPMFDDGAVDRFHAALGRDGVRVANGTWFGETARVFRLGFGLMTLPDLAVALEKVTRALRSAVPQAAALAHRGDAASIGGLGAVRR